MNVSPSPRDVNAVHVGHPANEATRDQRRAHVWREASITGTGHAVPSRVVTNAELSA